MSLTNRLSVFFLAALAVVLAGFSLTLYALAYEHLHARADHRLDAAMQTLVAAIEVHPGDVEWEPLERRITMGEDPAADQLRWTVHMADGRLVDCSHNLEQPGEDSAPPTARGWRVVVRRVRAGSFHSEPLDGQATPFLGSLSDAFPAGQVPGTVSLPNDRTFHGDELVLTVAVAEGPAAATLRSLALSMAIVSTFVWLTAAVCGRWLCRRALAPVTRMAVSARSLKRQSADGTFLDVAPTGDELEDLGRAFNELLSDLRESLERQRRFTGDASHQLRTPLAAMLASVDVALRKERGPAEYQRVLEVVRRRGGNLNQIIESLLFLARPEADSQPPDAEAVDLSEWCRGRLDGWAEHERAGDIRLEMPPEPIVVCTHPALLGQVLDNLLDNAIKYSDPGTPVVVAVAVEGDEVTLTVTDRGMGIPPDDLARIFEPFYRSQNARWLGKPGIGLGLAVVARLAAILGGRMETVSEAGHGSRFGLVLPAERTTSSHEFAQSEQAAAIG